MIDKKSSLFRAVKIFFILSLLVSSLFGFTNHLENEDSPYLKQHLHNPVDWHPWNAQSLAKAKEANKLIFLSIGYSTCHWCHVMAKESFEDISTARLLNKDYIAIKVDREELPHLDEYYQKLYRLLKKRSGGWPLNVVLTPDAKAFFISTYIPRQQQGIWEGLDTLLPRLAKEYQHERVRIDTKALAIEKTLRETQEDIVPVALELSLIKETFKGLQREYDELYYGFSTQPKFPEPAKIRVLFDLFVLGNKAAEQMALDVLKAMALRGLYDQVEGGFFRYSVDAAWEIPHFEKMLYTTAELIPLYVKAYELTQEPLFKDVVTQSILMIEKRFEKEDLYFSASDADSDHEEGAYFTYTYDEMMQSMKGISKKEKEMLIKVMELSETGNFKGKTHINFYEDAYPYAFTKIRKPLQRIRQNRDYPFIDKKINTAWNAMMIKALYCSARVDKRYAALADKRMHALLNKMYIKGVLYHQSLLNKVPQQKALLEDYAFLIAALLEGYQYHYQETYLHLAQQLSDQSLQKFYDAKQWYLNEEGFRVHAGMSDKYYSAPMNIMLMNLLKLAAIKGERKYLLPIWEALEQKSPLIKKNPSAYPSLIQLLLREKKGFVILKANKKRLLQAKEDIKTLRYPFILKKADERLDGYLACDINHCFSVEKTFSGIKKSIDTH